MTEIVKNNSSIKLDILDMGNVGSDQSESEGVFNSLFGGIDAKDNAEVLSTDININDIDHADRNMTEIINILKMADINLSENILEDIQNKLKELFKEIDIGNTGVAKTDSEHLNLSGNKNFVHIMKFLQELENLINSNQSGKDIYQKLETILDQVRTSLNEQVKNSNERKTSAQHTTKYDTKIVPQDQKNNMVSNKKMLHKETNSGVIGTNPNESVRTEFNKADLAFAKNTVEFKPRKKLTSKAESLNISQGSEKKPDLSNSIANKTSEFKTDALTQTSTNTNLPKDLNSENNLLRQTLAFTNKLDTSSNVVSNNTQNPSLFNQESNDKLLQNLNMLSKSWGNKLIEKIEKSIIDGVEEIEISLTPKSLGRLNVTINMQDTIAKISIITESSNAAALLSDAESKLSQMMEISGLKLASLQTRANQFGGNQKGKEQGHKLASTVKKTNIEDSSRPMEDIKKVNSENEGLNLIA